MPRLVLIGNKEYREGYVSSDPEPLHLDYCVACWPPNELTISHAVFIPIEWIEDDLADCIENPPRHPSYTIRTVNCFQCGKILTLADN